MKHYIFLSFITRSGGVQCYVASKAKYLEEQGWHVVVISGNNPKSKEKCLIAYLNKFLKNGNPFINIHPCHLPQFLVEKSINKCLNAIGPISNQDEVIVESWNSPTSLWGELLASQIHGRHMFLTANEHYRGGNSLYENKIDFYKFKMDRGEIFTSTMTCNRLFEGYRHYNKGDFTEIVITEDPVQDIDSQLVNDISKADWNICYIGRSNKPYVPNIYAGIEDFSKRHPEKTIQFIIVGKVDSERRNLLPAESSRLKVVELGDLYPLPRSLYTKVDVVIAGSGSARHSADENALVITADPETLTSHGLLGYDTNVSTFSENIISISFCEALEKALVEKTWLNQTNKWKKLPGIVETTALAFDIINNAVKELAYYDKRKILSGHINYLTLMRLLKSDIYWRLRIFFSPITHAGSNYS